MNDPEFLTLHEIVKKARQKLNHDNWDYIIGGAETETTLRRNRRALDCIAFRPRVLRDVSRIDASKTFLGRSLRLPLILAPVGSLENFAAEGGALCLPFGKGASLGLNRCHFYQNLIKHNYLFRNGLVVWNTSIKTTSLANTYLETF